MGFAERNGFVKEKTVQVDEIDRSLRNRLYNMVHRFSESSPMIHEELEYVVDRLGYQVKSTTNRNFDKIFSDVGFKNDGISDHTGIRINVKDENP